MKVAATTTGSLRGDRHGCLLSSGGAVVCASLGSSRWSPLASSSSFLFPVFPVGCGLGWVDCSEIDGELMMCWLHSLVKVAELVMVVIGK
ncbi:hypothetical protein M0R45_019620 [Rubus argutus]|uniref:Uncharacterized protein n=1 Tax=Rubus argutus TaxID=59490 RepID=A0AAW1X8D6_RUBAR